MRQAIGTTVNTPVTSAGTSWAVAAHSAVRVCAASSLVSLRFTSDGTNGPAGTDVYLPAGVAEVFYTGQNTRLSLSGSGGGYACVTLLVPDAAQL